MSVTSEQEIRKECQQGLKSKLQYTCCIKLSILVAVVPWVRNGASQIKGLSLYFPILTFNLQQARTRLRPSLILIPL